MPSKDFPALLGRWRRCVESSRTSGFESSARVERPKLEQRLADSTPWNGARSRGAWRRRFSSRRTGVLDRRQYLACGRLGYDPYRGRRLATPAVATRIPGLPMPSPTTRREYLSSATTNRLRSSGFDRPRPSTASRCRCARPERTVLLGSHRLRHPCRACRATALVSRLLAWFRRHRLVLGIAALRTSR